MSEGTWTIFYAKKIPLRVSVSGMGTVTPADGELLATGETYEITAHPGPGFAFAGWSEDVVADTATVKFVMRTNLLLQSNFVPTPFNSIKGNYQGLIWCEGSADEQAFGFIKAKVTAEGVFSATVRLANSTYRISGIFPTNGTYACTLRQKESGSQLDLQLQLNLEGLDELTGRVSLPSVWTSEILAHHEVFDAVTNPAPNQGSYTMIFAGSDDVSHAPGGDGIGTVQVDGSGNLKFAGTLGDGTKVSQATFLSKDGDWPVYIPLYSGGGSIKGWLALTNDSVSDISGTLNWTKPSKPGSKLYPEGFRFDSTVLGSRYQFTNGVPILDLNSGKIILSDGNSPAITNSFSLDANSTVTGTNLSIKMNTLSGLFRGQVTDPTTAETIPVAGAVLQKPNCGSGYFLRSGLSGWVSFGP
jgi:hypothetical protein